MVFLKGYVCEMGFVIFLSSALLAARFVALPCCDLCGLTLGESCPCFQFVVLLLDAAMLELRVRVGALLDVLELLVFWLAGRIQSKEGSKTLVFKGERYVKVFSQAFCFESVFLRASVAFGVLQQLCSCIVKSLSAATQCAGAGSSDCHTLPISVCFLQVLCSQGSRFCSCAGQWLLEGRLRESSKLHSSKRLRAGSLVLVSFPTCSLGSWRIWFFSCGHPGMKVGMFWDFGSRWPHALLR